VPWALGGAHQWVLGVDGIPNKKPNVAVHCSKERGGGGGSRGGVGLALPPMAWHEEIG